MDTLEFLLNLRESVYFVGAYSAHALVDPDELDRQIAKLTKD